VAKIFSKLSQNDVRDMLVGCCQDIEKPIGSLSELV
jgi:hypothetical protein